MKKGLYLYCLRKKNPTTIRVAKTIGGGEVQAFPYEELEAVVSEVNLKEFSSKEIQKRAQEDLNWIKEKAQIHEHVIEQAMEVGGPPANTCGVSQWRAGRIVPVIPMKFGTLFKTKKNLEAALRKNYSRFRKTLRELEGKQEWGVKIYLNERIFEKQLEKKNKNLLKSKKEIASLPKGMGFFAKKQMGNVVKKERNKYLNRITREVFETLQKYAFEASQGKILDKAITGREESMVLNASFLVKEEKVKEFQREVNKLETKYKNLGFIIQESGPWPPYNFTKI